jgi:secreted Zn-dependent insulinase-like peptidase
MILFISYKHINDDFINKIKKMFSNVQLRDKYIIDNSLSIRKLNNKYELLKVNTIDKEHKLIIRWCVNGVIRYKNNQCSDSFNIVDYILGNESTGSLYDILIKKQYITDISTGIEQSYHTQSILIMIIILTDTGYKKYK